MPDTNPMRWQPDREPAPTGWPMPTLAQALRRGFAGKCPACGQARLFAGWLRVRPVCPACTAPLGSLRADDAPPYITIFIVGHLVIASALVLDQLVRLSVWSEMALFLPLTLLLSLTLLRPVKGATVGLMLRLHMVTPDDTKVAQAGSRAAKLDPKLGPAG
jgi:uncharacterized protein (DUF983 family)